MRIVAGVDFGTLSTRVTLLDSVKGRLGTAVAPYPLLRKREDPDFATQSHQDQMDALAVAMRAVLQETGVNGDQIEALALDTTGSSVIVVDAQMQPLDEYYLWCDHRALREAQQITRWRTSGSSKRLSVRRRLPRTSGALPKLLHWLRHNPARRAQFASAFEHCDMVAATLCASPTPAQVKRSICARPQMAVERTLGRLSTAGISIRA